MPKARCSNQVMLLFILVTSIPIIGTAARAADCDAALDEKLMSTDNIINAKSGKDAFKRSFCLKSFSQAQQANASGAGASYEGIGAESTQSASSFNSWKQSNCEDVDFEQQTQSYYMSAQKALNKEVVEAWRICKQNLAGLSCFVQPDVDGEYTFTVSWKPTGPKDAFVVGSTITNAKNLSYPASPSSVLPPSKILYGVQNIIFEKLNPNKSSRMVLNVTYDENSNHSCVAYIPKVLPPSPTQQPPSVLQPKPFDITGAWCRGTEPFVKWSRTGTSLKQQRWLRSLGSNTSTWASEPFVIESSIQLVNNGAFRITFTNKGLIPEQTDKLEETYIIEDANTVTFQQRMRATPVGWTPAQGLNEHWPYQLKRC